MQVGDWEEAIDRFQVSQEEQKTLAAMQAAALENRAMSLAEGQSLLSHQHGCSSCTLCLISCCC